MLDLSAPPAIVAQAMPSAAPSSPFAPLHLAIDDATLRDLPQHTLEATDEHGTGASYAGVDLRELLTKAGVPSGKAIRGRAMRLIVIVGASDGYHVVFALPDLDPGFTDRAVLIAQRRDGTALSASEGPLRLIVPGDKRDARWVRQVTTVDVEEAP